MELERSIAGLHGARVRIQQPVADGEGALLVELDLLGRRAHRLRAWLSVIGGVDDAGISRRAA
jgi:hypothetical protein